MTFWLSFQAEFGQRICIVGNCPGLGNWQHKAAPELQWSDGHKWNVTVEVPNGHVIEYKYVVLQPDGLTALQWQQGNNAVLAVLVPPTPPPPPPWVFHNPFLTSRPFARVKPEEDAKKFS